MINLSQAMSVHVTQDVTTLAYCWTITRNDGAIFGFTDHDEAITIAGVTHDPQTGLNATAAEAELGLAVATMDVEGALRSDKISADDLRAGKFNGAEVKTALVNWADPTQNTLLRSSKIGKIEISGNAFKVELQSLTEALDKRRGRLVRRNCDAQLGDQRCKVLVNTVQLQATGLVVANNGPNDFAASGLTAYNAQWFDGGKLEWLTGNNAGQTSLVAMHNNANGSVNISIWIPTPGPIVVGDSFRVTAGCDKAFATCKGKFSNSLNFRGFPHLPGNDAVYSYVDGTGIFDGQPLVP